MNRDRVINEELRKEMIEHRDVLLNLRAVIETKTGRDFLKYLFKNFEVAGLPDLGMEGPMLMDKLGFLRAGQAIFKLVSEANAVVAGQLLAEIEKEAYEKLYAESGFGRD